MRTQPRLHSLLLTAFLAVPIFGSNAWADDPGRIIVYAGFGTPTGFVLSGRVLEDKGERSQDTKRGRFRNLVDTVKAMETDEITDVRVEVRVGTATYVARTDDDGVFRVEATGLKTPLEVGELTVRVKLIDDEDHPTRPATGIVYVLVDAPGLAVISDFDDTVAESGVTDKKRLIYKTFTRNAADMKPVPGASAAFEAAGKAGARAFFYVSGSPQNLYERITAFLSLQKLPLGPIMLKNFGSDKLTDQRGYKKGRIRRLMKAFPKLRFVLVGDSGEQDPEIYRDIDKELPGRVAGIVIRRVSGGENSPDRFQGMTTVHDYAGRADVIAELIGGAKP